MAEICSCSSLQQKMAEQQCHCAADGWTWSVWTLVPPVTVDWADDQHRLCTIMKNSKTSSHVHSPDGSLSCCKVMLKDVKHRTEIFISIANVMVCS